MKKFLLSLAAVGVLAGCSSDPEKLQIANDAFQKNDVVIPQFAPLASGGVNLPKADNTYELPKVVSQKTAGVDIRPPSTPLAIIPYSVSQFDGERALIAYPAQQASVYSLEQVARLFKEEGVASQTKQDSLITDWMPTTRSDDKSGTEIQYKVEQIFDRNAAALLVSVEQMRRDGIIFTPTLVEKQRYSADRLNQIVNALNQTYTKQQQELANASGPVQSQIVTDMNGNQALSMNVGFKQAWDKLGAALPMLGFETKSETSGKGYRDLKYSPMDSEDWLRLGVEMPELEKGEYSMQISDHGHRSSVVLSDEKGNALTEQNAARIYQALLNLLAR